MNTFKLKDYNLKDTIAAIATFPSRSALGVIRISGKKSLSIAYRIFRPKKEKDIRKAKTYTLHYGWVIEKTGREKKRFTVIDEVLVAVMRAPYSYTREDVVEISCHGGIIVLNKILEIILLGGARLALPGEFTYRAVVFGRISLLQAESVVDIIEARSEEGLRLATRQLSGENFRKIEDLKNKIKELFTRIEASVNFPEDEIDVSLSSVKQELSEVGKAVNNMLEGSEQARILKEGLKCVICGKANAGKSTLFNYLLKEERVIVSKIPGTTRDVIEESISIRGVPLRIYDTAGILQPRDLTEKKAMDKTNQMFEQADLIILVLDGSKAMNRDDRFLLNKVKNKNAIFVMNKSDLPQKLESGLLSGQKGHPVKISALKKTGMEKLEKIIFDTVYRQGLNRQDIIFLSRYQRDILVKIKDSLVQAADLFNKGYTVDFISLLVRECLDNLGKLTGEILSEEVMENIFSRFCIGK